MREKESIQFESRLCKRVPKDPTVKKKSSRPAFIAIMVLQPVTDPSNTAPFSTNLIAWRGW